jgi:hypothetical protein
MTSLVTFAPLASETQAETFHLLEKKKIKV